MKLDLLTNATVVDDAIRFVEERMNNKNNNEKRVGEIEGQRKEIKNKIF